MSARTPSARAELAEALQAQLSQRFAKQLHLEGAGSGALGAWFLGPKAENEELLLRLMKRAVAAHAESRRKYYPDDPEWITAQRKQAPAYIDAVLTLEQQLEQMLNALDASVPFYSYRYQGHMLWDVALPAVLGYVAALLYNQNNVAAEASPVTTWLEMLVGDDLCRMLGYYTPDRDPDTGEYVEPDPGRTVAWGHITCDGSVANMEGLWAARNAKLYPLGLAAALRTDPALAPARGLSVRLPTGAERPLVELDTWELLNLESEVVLALPTRVQNNYVFEEGLDVAALLETYTVQHVGLAPFLRRFAPDAHDPLILAPATAHYSWPKGAALVGLGRGSHLPIAIDLNARLDIGALRRALDECLRDRRPVIMVVAVLGTTEQSAVDPLAAIIAERERYRRLGLEFWLHADAAWGGYFASMLRPAKGVESVLASVSDASAPDPHTVLYGPDLVMSAYVNEQYAALEHADSIAVDPHKAGYVPYPAGGLCYRNAAARHLVAFTAPVVYHGGVDPTVGVFGIEGSKPGAAPAAVYLSHRVIRTDSSGYGRILGRCLWNSKRLYCALVSMARGDDPFAVVALQRLPSERVPDPRPEDIAAELHKLSELIVPKTNGELLAALNADPRLLEWFRGLGSDQLIISYAFNFKRAGQLNPDVALANRLNRAIFTRLSLARRSSDLPNVPLFVTSSELEVSSAGRVVGDLKRRLGIHDLSGAPLQFLISTTMDPWLTDTAQGDFIPTLIEELRKEVLKAILDDPDFQ